MAYNEVGHVNPLKDIPEYEPLQTQTLTVERSALRVESSLLGLRVNPLNPKQGRYAPYPNGTPRGDHEDPAVPLLGGLKGWGIA